MLVGVVVIVVALTYFRPWRWDCLRKELPDDHPDGVRFQKDA